MDVAPQAAPSPATTPVSGRGEWLALPLAPLIGMGISAVASIIVGIMAVPVALVLTRDLYVASLAVSYGPYAAAQVVVTIVVATTFMTIAWLLPTQTHHYTVRSVLVGAGGTIIGLALATLPLMGLFSYGPALAPTLLNGAFAALAGAMAGGIAHRRGPLPGATARLRAALIPITLFALVLALLLEGWAAVISLFG